MVLTRALGASNLSVESEERGQAYGVSLRQRTCEVNRMGENRSFILTCYMKTVSVYDFKLVWVILHLPVKEFSKLFTNKRKITMFCSKSFQLTLKFQSLIPRHEK